MIAMVLVVSGAIMALGQTLTASAITWEVEVITLSEVPANRRIDIATATNKELTFNIFNVNSWASSDVDVAEFKSATNISATFTVNKAGKFTAYQATREGLMDKSDALVYDSTAPASYVITTNHTSLENKNDTEAIPITVKNLAENTITGKVTWSSDTPEVATVGPTTGVITAVDNGYARLAGRFTDCYGQEQTIIYSAIVGSPSASNVVQGADGNYYRPIGRPANVWEKTDEGGVPKHPAEFIYSEDPSEDTNPKEVVRGEDGIFYIQEPVNVFTPIAEDGTISTTPDDKVWGGADKKPGNTDDKKVKPFNGNYYADLGQNVFGQVLPSGDLDERIGGGADGNPTTSPTMPIVEVDGKYYYGPLTEEGETFYIGDRVPGGNGQLSSNPRPFTMASTDQKFYLDTETGKMVTTPPVTTVNATGITFTGTVPTTVAISGKVSAPGVAVAPADATVKTVEWSSSNTGVATVNPNTGEVTGVAGGTAIITATLTNPDNSTRTQTYTITVQQPITNGQGSAVDGRVLTADKAGDNSAWVEIATNGGYSLIVRAQTTGQAAFYSSGNYQAYGTATGPLRVAINTWYRGLSSTSALRTHSVGHDALSKPGTWANLSAANGFSVPTGVSTTADDTAFPLSFQEAANYCSVQWYNGSSWQGSITQANVNWNKLTDRTSTHSRLRSPGNIASHASILHSSGSAGNTGGVTSSYWVRPALWVQSSIFNQ